jgi:hypothetical protein
MYTGGAMNASRRIFLRNFSRLAGGLLISQSHSKAQTSNPRRIDVSTFHSPAYLAFLKAHNQGASGVFPSPGGSLTGAYAGWTLAEDLEDMDRSGTATAILSIWTSYER